jgi:hypothetical protein
MEYCRTDLEYDEHIQSFGAFLKKGWMQNIVNTYEVNLTQMINIECNAHI